MIKNFWGWEKIRSEVDGLVDGYYNKEADWYLSSDMLDFLSSTDPEFKETYGLVWLDEEGKVDPLY